MRKVLLVPIDGSKHSKRAIDYAVELAVANDLAIELLNIQPVYNTHYANKKIGKERLQAYKEERASKILHDGKGQINDQVEVFAKMRLGVPIQEICLEATEIEAEKIVIASKSVWKGNLLGSMSSSLVKKAPCPVEFV